MTLLLLLSIVFIIVPSGIQCKKAQPPPPPTPTPTPTPSPAPSNPLGLLQGLIGTWVGSGFTMISLPDFDSTPPSTGPQDFRLVLHNTVETLTFTPIGVLVPNRGSLVTFDVGTDGQPDINLAGLTYIQRVSDAQTRARLHIETGIWVDVPATEIPNQKNTIVRMSSIPHGNSLMAQSTFLLSVLGGPLIGVSNSTPISTPTGPNINGPYLGAFQSTPGFNNEIVNNPNLLLEQAIKGQNITNTVVIAISTNPVGGILNIPFLSVNANTTSLSAIFWIETVQNPDGTTFLQLQYTQTIILNFLGINWPHITVSTLVLQ